MTAYTAWIASKVAIGPIAPFRELGIFAAHLRNQADFFTFRRRKTNTTT
jgi:hypothetical protein